MARNERQTCKDLIEPALDAAGWDWEEQLRIGPGRVNLTGDAMYDAMQALVADYLLRYFGIPLAVLETKAEGEDAADGMQQGSRYAGRLMLRFSIATNGRDWILTDNESGAYESFPAPPTPQAIIARYGVDIDWQRWGPAFSAAFHIDQITRKRTRPYQEMAIAKTLWQFAQGIRRVLLLMATGTGKTFTVFQLVWKLMNSHARGQPTRGRRVRRPPGQPAEGHRQRPAQAQTGGERPGPEAHRRGHLRPGLGQPPLCLSGRRPPHPVRGVHRAVPRGHPRCCRRRPGRTARTLDRPGQPPGAA